MSADAFEIDGRPIGPDHPPYVIAEMSGNHNGELSRALAIIEAAKDSGADAVKLQTYTADTITMDCKTSDFIIPGGQWAGRRLYELYQEAHTPWDWHEALFAKGRDLGITVFSTPFDATAVDFLEDLGAPAYKIASFEVVDIPLIERVATTGKPLIVSTGMANRTEIGEAVEAIRRVGNRNAVLLHCISAYPAPIEEANLRTIPDMVQAFGMPAGLSDHTLGIAAAVTATALGACVIEKHVTLARADGGVDSAFSLEPAELKDLVENVRAAHVALGRVNYGSTKSEKNSMPFRRSLYVVADVKKGDPLTEQNVRSIRPGFGLAPKNLPKVLGEHAARDLKRGEPLSFDMITEFAVRLS